jgi:transglutaminase-like putative cysteine protease
MAKMVRAHRDNREVRDLALRIVSGCPPMNDQCRIVRVRDWAADAFAYEKDPVGGDLVHDPVDMVRRIAVHGTIGGDCDDASILISALLQSLGIRTRFAAISIRRDQRLHHVGVEAQDGPRAWMWLDAFGRRKPPPATAILRVPV